MKSVIQIESSVYDSLLSVAKMYGVNGVEGLLEHIADSVSSGTGCIATLNKCGSDKLNTTAA